MAKRKSLNRRSGRFRRASTDSGVLDPDMKLLGEEESFWWKNLEDNTIARRSTLLKLGNETSAQLDPTLRLSMSNGKNEWWKVLDTSDAANTDRTIREKEHASGTEGNNNNDHASHDSESGRETIQKKKPPLHAEVSRSLKSNAFENALDVSKESRISMPFSKSTGQDFNNSAISENVVQTRSTPSRKSIDSKANYSKSMEDVVKVKPKLAGKRRLSKSRNMFDDVLKENVVETAKKLSLRRSGAAESQKGNEDNESIIVGEPRASAFGLSFDNSDSASSNIPIPKAQSTMLESTAVQMYLSDSSIDERNVQKRKPKVLKWTAKKAPSNNFQDVLASEDNRGTEEGETTLQKSNLIKQKAKHKQSSQIVPSTSVGTSNVVSNKTLSTSIQKDEKGSSSKAQNNASQVDADESDDPSLVESRIHAIYKPKSKFLSWWKRNNQLEDTSKNHATLVEEGDMNVGEPNMHQKNDAETDSLRKSLQLNDKDSDGPAEHRESGNYSISNQSDQIGNKSTRAASSHLENTGTSSQLNVLSRKSMTVLNKSQKSMVHLTQRSSNFQDGKLTESLSVSSMPSKVTRNSSNDLLHKRTDKTKEDDDDQIAATSDYDNDSKLKQSSQHSAHSKSSSHSILRTISKVTTQVTDKGWKENGKDVGRMVHSSMHSSKVTSQPNLPCDDESDKEDNQNIGHSIYKTSSHNISSNPVSKCSKAGAMTVAEDRTYGETDQVMRRTTRRSTREGSSRHVTESSPLRVSRTRISTIVDDDTDEEDGELMQQSTRRSRYNKSSRSTSDCPPSKVAKSKTTSLLANDTDNEMYENKRSGSRVSIGQGSLHHLTESSTPRISRTRISTVAEGDTSAEDDEVMRQSAHRSKYNKSLSRRKSDSSKAANDTDDEINENKLQKLRTTSIRKRSSRRIIESPTSSAAGRNTSAQIEEGDQSVGQNRSHSIRNKSNAIINHNVIDEEDPPVHINETLAGTQNTSKSGTVESIISFDGDENRPRKEKAGASMHRKSVSVHIPQKPAENTTNEKLTVLYNNENDDVDDDETESFQLVTSRRGRRSRTTSESVTSNSISHTFRPRKCKSGVSYKDDLNLYGNEDEENTDKQSPDNMRSKSFKKSNNRTPTTLRIRHSTLNDVPVSQEDESTSKTMRQSTRRGTISEERSNRHSNVMTTTESMNGADAANMQSNNDLSTRPTESVTNSPTSSTSQRRLQVSCESENSIDEIVTRSQSKTAPMQSAQQKRRYNISSTSDEVEITEENQIHHSKTFDRQSIKNSPSRKSLNPAVGRNRNRKSTVTFKHANSTQDNTSEEDENIAESGATVLGRSEKADEVRDMSDIDISNITRRSPLLSSTRRSLLPNTANKRMSKLSDPRSSKHLAPDNTPTSPVDHVTENDFAVQENARHDPGNQKSPVGLSGALGSDRKKVSDESRKPSNISEARAPTSLGNNDDETRQIERGSYTVNNTISEETSTSHEEPAQSRVEKEQSTRNEHPITKQQNKANGATGKNTTLNKSQGHSQMDTLQENSIFGRVSTKKKTNVEDSRNKRTPGNCVIKDRTLEKAFIRKESGTQQRSMVDFLKGMTQKGFNRPLRATQSDSQSQHLPTLSDLRSHPEKVEEIKRLVSQTIGEEGTIPRNEDDLPLATVRLKTQENAAKRKKSSIKQVKPRKAIDSAYLVHGKVYKPPALSRPKQWVTNRLYQYLEKCLSPKYDLATRVRSEKFIKHLVDVTTLVKKRKKYDSYKDDVDRLMREMANLGIIKNRSDFYHFCFTFLPYELRVKLIPMTLPGNIQTIPYDPRLLYTPFLES